MTRWPNMLGKQSALLPSWMASLPPTLQSSPGLQTIALQAATMGCIEVKIPKVNLMAGRVLAHCIAVIETLFKMWDPMIFKLGYTHDPIWRWSNDLYGYCQSREKWSNMVILWISDEPFAPAYVGSFSDWKIQRHLDSNHASIFS